MAVNLHVMASWSVFKPSALQTFVARRLGAFSVYREGMGRVLLNTAIETLVEARRPLMIFPEGVISRTHDCLGELMDGAAFMARQAAKKRNKQNPDAKVVIHPIAVKYQFPGDLDEAIMAILTEIEERLTWKPQSKASLFGRISKIGNALVALKEIEFLGGPQSGYIHERIDPLARVKNLRMAIVPDMVEGAISDDERDRRWRQLADLYLAQQLRFYPAGYVAEGSPAERVLETVERFEEDLTDCSRPHGPLKAVLKVGEAIEG